GLGLDPMLLAVPVALAATCAFMLPVATPPNAIAYGSGYMTIGQMVRGGVWLNLIGIVLITVVTMTLLVWVFGLTLRSAGPQAAGARGPAVPPPTAGGPLP